MIDYILTSEHVTKNITSIIIDEEGLLRVKGKKDTDHNTIVMNMKINSPRNPEYMEKWKPTIRLDFPRISSAVLRIVSFTNTVET